MGQDIERDDFDAADFARYAERLQRGLEALELLLARPGFGDGPSSLGAELEMFLVDEHGDALGRNQQILETIDDDRLTVELNRFNLECNLAPCPLAGRPFAALEREIEEILGRLRPAASALGARVAMVGILPTLRECDLEPEAMTQVARFRALSRSVRRLRQGPFEIDIQGDEPLRYLSKDVTVEGANTGFQLHLRVEPEHFQDTYNAVQLATAPAIAVSGNSPIFLGHRLWHETRIALFKQSVDERRVSWEAWRPSRVSFGNGWVREGPFELFAETVALHAPLLPVVGDEEPLHCVQGGGTPGLEELRLHHGTVWRWNRAVYDPRGEGHVRIEMRALPAGPTVIDMLASAAFMVGVGLGLRAESDWMVTALPWKHAESNFYRAAQTGLDATLLWPSREPPSPRPIAAATLVRQLLPVAEKGLGDAGVEPSEIDRLLQVVAERVDTGQTGAVWMRRSLERLDRRLPREEAVRVLLANYLEAEASGEPVHRWPLPADRA